MKRIELDDISFGHVALSKGLITEDNLKEAVEIQNKLRSMGIAPKKIGEILLEKEYISRENVRQVLDFQQQAQDKQEIAGYEIVQKLGQGGMGTVYKARQKSMDRLVALKVLPRKLASNKEFIQRFVREARASARLNHENIITGIDVGEDGGLYYFAMEYAEGKSLDKVVAENGPFSEEKALDILRQMAHALDHAHKNGFVHRDVKPQNIILSPDGVAKLCDLGLAKSSRSKESVTSTNISMGTPHYISPEQAKGEPTDIRSDIYSLGATVYYLLVGEVPFAGASPMVVMTKHLTEPVPRPSDRNGAISRDMSELVVRMMNKDVSGRIGSPAELLEAIELVEQHKYASPKKRGRRKRVSSRIRRNLPPKALVEGAPEAQPEVEVLTRSRPSRRRRPTRATSSISGGRRPRRSREFRASRIRNARSLGKHESVYIVVGLVVLVALVLFIVFTPVADKMKSMMTEKEQTEDVQNYKIQAMTWLDRAKSFEARNPYDYNDQIQRYQDVIRNFPDTMAAKEAQQHIQRIKKDPTYRPDR